MYNSSFLILFQASNRVKLEPDATASFLGLDVQQRFDATLVWTINQSSMH